MAGISESAALFGPGTLDGGPAHETMKPITGLSGHVSYTRAETDEANDSLHSPMSDEGYGGRRSEHKVFFYSPGPSSQPIQGFQKFQKALLKTTTGTDFNCVSIV